MKHVEHKAVATFRSPPPPPPPRANVHEIKSLPKFTVEREDNKSLAFSDVLVTRNQDRILTTIYIKPTLADRYFQYSSYTPNMKSLLWPKFYTIVWILTSRMKMRKANNVLWLVASTFMLSGFPRKFCDNHNNCFKPHLPEILNCLLGCSLFKVFQLIFITL